MAYNLPFRNGLGFVGCNNCVDIGNRPTSSASSCQSSLSASLQDAFTPFSKSQQSQLIAARRSLPRNMNLKQFDIPPIPAKWMGVI